jgi:hypothetical protein
LTIADAVIAFYDAKYTYRLAASDRIQGCRYR